MAIEFPQLGFEGASIEHRDEDGTPSRFSDHLANEPTALRRNVCWARRFASFRRLGLSYLGCRPRRRASFPEAEDPSRVMTRVVGMARADQYQGRNCCHLIQALLHSEHAPELALTAGSGQRDPGLASDPTLENIDSQSTTQRELKSTGQLHGVKLVRSNTRPSDRLTLFMAGKGMAPPLLQRGETTLPLPKGDLRAVPTSLHIERAVFSRGASSQYLVTR